MARISGDIRILFGRNTENNVPQTQPSTEASVAQPVSTSTPEPVELAVPSTYIKDNTSQQRFSEAIWKEELENMPITIVGAGGIGSWTSLLLARAGAGNIFMFDGDTIESHNMAGQLYRLSDIGSYKVDAMRDIIAQYVPTVKGGFFAEYYANQTLSKVTITALDSMKARKLVWQEYRRQHADNPEGCLFIDGRMTADAFQVFVFRLSNKSQVKMYEEKCLFNDEDAAHLPCSYKATSHIGAGIGACITGIVTQHIHFKSDDMFATNVKFYTEADYSLGVSFKQLKTWSYK